jgi:hypothetical protein
MIISVNMPFCGDLELTPQSCFSKSSWSRLVILGSPLGRRGLIAVNPRRVSPFLKQGLLQSPAASKIISGARRNVIADWDTFRRRAILLNNV